MSISLKNDAGTFITNLNQSNPTENVNIALPTTSGTMAMTSQLGRRNYLINGNFHQIQRGTSFTPALNQTIYTADRWYVYQVGASCVVTANTVPITNDTKTCWSVTGAAGNTTCGLGQKVESYEASYMRGKSTTISFTAKTTSNKRIYYHVSYPTTNENDWAASTNVVSGYFDLTTTATRYSFNVPANTHFWKGARVEFYPDGGLGAGITWYMQDIKWEDGVVPTDGWHPYDGEFGGEVQACQRYYEVLAVVHTTSPSTQFQTNSFSVVKRIVPSSLATVQVSGSGMPTIAATGDKISFYQNSSPSALGTMLVTASAEL